MTSFTSLSLYHLLYLTHPPKIPKLSPSHLCKKDIKSPLSIILQIRDKSRWPWKIPSFSSLGGSAGLSSLQGDNQASKTSSGMPHCSQGPPVHTRCLSWARDLLIHFPLLRETEGPLVPLWLIDKHVTSSWRTSQSETILALAWTEHLCAVCAWRKDSLQNCSAWKFASNKLSVLSSPVVLVVQDMTC